MSHRPNILLITTDEERANLPRPPGYLAARARALGRARHDVQQLLRRVDDVQFVALGHLHRAAPAASPPSTTTTSCRTSARSTRRSARSGRCCAVRATTRTYQGKWHLSNLYVDPANPVSTSDALEPYGFSEWNDWGDIDGGAWAGLQVDPVIAGQAAGWLRNRAPVVVAGPAVVHGGELRQPARHHELRLRRPLERAAPARAVARGGDQAAGRRPRVPRGSGTSTCRRACTTTCRARRPPCASTRR